MEETRAGGRPAASGAASPAEPVGSAESVSSEESVARGEVLAGAAPEGYECFSCHGPEGVGGSAQFVEQMAAEGVKFVTNAHIGVTIPGKKIVEENDAVLLATGSEKPRDLPVAGRELKGIHFAMDFLPQQNRRVAGFSATEVCRRNRMTAASVLSASRFQAVTTPPAWPSTVTRPGRRPAEGACRWPTSAAAPHR